MPFESIQSSLLIATDPEGNEETTGKGQECSLWAPAGNEDGRLAVIRTYRRAGAGPTGPPISGPLALSAHVTRGDGEGKAGFASGADAVLLAQAAC